MSVGGRSRWVAGVALALALAGCSASGADPAPLQSSASSSTASPSPASPSPSAFDPAPTSVHLPNGVARGTAVPLVVLVPGGGWQSHDSTGLTPLAQAISDAGYVVALTEYRAGDEGVGFPDTFQDVLCSAALAASLAKDAGYPPSSVTLVGHSAGGHLVALAGVSGTTLARPCDDPVPAIDGVVGLAGIYDAAAFQPMMTDWFGTPRAADPALWDSGDPIHYVRSGAVPTSLHVLLIHGDDDTIVPLSQSTMFATALKAAGVPVQLDVLPGETHMSVITVGVVSKPILEWLTTWAA